MGGSMRVRRCYITAKGVTALPCFKSELLRATHGHQPFICAPCHSQALRAVPSGTLSFACYVAGAPRINASSVMQAVLVLFANFLIMGKLFGLPRSLSAMRFRRGVHQCEVRTKK